ncbi:PREDICTED: proclotting enzyme-like [Dinoponera quadriceps]|uniref:Phenoloxidase-activating factor 2 n=1 Tax=Dinoponera quadriceps TaxID=609295 RepID=A0A6P3YGS7_DINQU|nr:PREDICTED: proclotting enzyme-like [Dinoponera quadriceps]
MWTYTNISRFVLFCSLCIYQCCHCLPVTNFEIIADPARLEDQTWRARFGDSDLPRFSENVSHPYLRGKRLVNLGPGTLTKQKTYQACIAPGNRNGHCKHFSGCVLEEFRSNFERFVNYMCIIEQTYIGVCCPDSAVTVRADKTFNDDLASVLPAIANIDDDEEEWDGTAGESGPPADDKVSGNDATSKRDGTDEETRKPRKPRGCGMTTKMKTRIVGGRPADPKEWPWMAALLRQGAIQYCGGVLITDRHVLTAAHCVYRYKPRDITVRLGEYDFTKPDETRALDFMVSEIRVHRDFVYTTYENDIAIIKIHRPTTFNSYIWPVCLPPIQQTFENKSAVVTGWGTQYYGGPASTVLMEVGVPVWPQERCVRSFTQQITGTTLCAGAYEGGRDACQGDSGGPLLHQLGNGRWVNIGIVSWGIRCGDPGFPGIYTRVSSYLDWIFANAVF